MYVSPRERYLEAENAALRTELETYKARMGEFKTMLQSEPPETINLLTIPNQVSLNLAAKVEIAPDDAHPGWHITAVASPNGQSLEHLRIGYYVSDNLSTLRAKDQVAALDMALVRMRMHLADTARRIERAKVVDRWPERFFET